jgi:PIN like domain
LKICTDEHVSTWIVGIIRDSCLGSNHSLEHVEDYHLRGIEDEIWVRRFAKAGGEAILSADSEMLRRHNEIVAICDSGLRLAILPSKWANSARNLQASHIMFWWPRIQYVFTSCRPRQCWKVPWGYNEKDTLIQVKVNFENSRRRLKKSSTSERSLIVLSKLPASSAAMKTKSGLRNRSARSRRISRRKSRAKCHLNAGPCGSEVTLWRWLSAVRAVGLDCLANEGCTFGCGNAAFAHASPVFVTNALGSELFSRHDINQIICVQRIT